MNQPHVGSIVQTCANLCSGFCFWNRCLIKQPIRSNPNAQHGWPAPCPGVPLDCPWARWAPGDDMFLELPKLIQDALIGRLDTIHLQDEILGKTNATGWLGLGLCWERLRKKPAVFFPKFGRLPAHAPVIPGRWQQTLAKEQEAVCECVCCS